VCRLWPDEAVTHGPGVAEGPSSHRFAHGFVAHAAVDASNLAALPLLPGIECLTIGADHDLAG
jgi:hypothetical protein